MIGEGKNANGLLQSDRVHFVSEPRAGGEKSGRLSYSTSAQLLRLSYLGSANSARLSRLGYLGSAFSIPFKNNSEDEVAKWLGDLLYRS